MQTFEEAIEKATFMARKERRVIYILWQDEGERYMLSYELSFFAHAVLEPLPKGDILVTDRRQRLAA